MMVSTRRAFLKGAGLAVVAGAASGGLAGAEAPSGQSAGATGKNATARTARGLTVCNLQTTDGISLGVRTKRGIVDVRRAAKARRIAAPATTDDLVRGRDVAGLEKLLADEAAIAKFLVAEQDARFGPCIASPEKILMMGFNYKKHVAEVKVPVPTSPVFFNKFNNALLGHGGTIPLPSKVARKFDYEVELVVVLGRTARDVAPADALSYVWGYATGNDFSARDLQFKTSQFMLGKTSDGFAPLGPWLVSADQVGDPQNLKLECRVNGEVRQSSNTNDMIFSCAELVSYASQHMTLRPGDIIFTGTPEGVILGKPEAQQVWLKAGDRISTEIEKLGELRFDLA
jgi:2-keto-4-pentenoate hydratase/2-oxohepta-3-ene-1,7-dioic acid hydratase in catechol pathway